MRNCQKRILAMATLLWGLSFALPAQYILKINEITRPAGKTYRVDSVGTPIVHINSKLEIRPDLAAIRDRALELSGQSAQGQLLRGKIERVEKILRNQQQIVNYIQKALTGDAVPADSLLGLLRQMTGDIRRDQLLRTDFNEYNREYNEQLRRDREFAKNDRFLYALGRFNEQLDSINLELRGLENSARLQFSLRAFRKDKGGGARLHIENFDQFEQGEFFNVDTWVLTFSADQMQQLQNYRQLADTLNLGAEKALLSFKNQVFNLLPSLNCIGTMPNELRLAAGTVPEDVRQLIDRSLADVNAQIARLKEDLTSSAPGQSFDLQGQVSTLRAQLDSIVEQTKRGFLNLPESNANLRNIRNCALQTRDDVIKIQEIVKNFPTDYLQKTFLASDDLADEVLSFDLDKIPPVGTLDLQYTGRREAGDEILIQALFVPKDDTINRRRNFTIIDEREVKMMLTGAHSNTKIGVIMAQPYTMKNEEDVSNFRFTPSAALLLKFGSRRSHFYNKFLDPAIGLITSSPDFDRDGVPEFSAGLTGTIFRDIISLGWSWNFGADRPFYFIGIHLPFNLPGLPVNTVQTNQMQE